MTPTVGAVPLARPDLRPPSAPAVARLHAREPGERRLVSSSSGPPRPDRGPRSRKLAGRSAGRPQPAVPGVAGGRTGPGPPSRPQISNAPDAGTPDALGMPEGLGSLPVFDDFLLPPSTDADPEPGSSPGFGTPTDTGRFITALRAAGPARPRLPVPPRAPRRSASLVSRHSVVVAVMVVAVAVVLAGSAAAGLALSSPTPPPTAGLGATRSPSATAPRSAGGGHATSGGGQRSSSRTTKAPGSSTAPPAHASSPPPSATPGSGGPPHLSALRPAAGAAGQKTTVAGSGLFSASGVIVAYVGGAAAPTSCSSQTTCTVTVPDLGPPHKTTLVVKTAEGSSNALAFDYT